MAEAQLDSVALGELNSTETRTLFDAADKLSLLGVGKIVNLPQIIVVGDQSSGKSSVLEAISHVHFPVQGGVCTRFATELVLRPGSRRWITATVQFAESSKPAHTLQVADFNQEDINNIISSAKEQMGVSESGRSFSKDVLRLEIEGPDMYPLTLVDLPGIFHTATAKQSIEGKTTVMELVESYMSKKNSIILAIISANNQLANQIVMQEAAKHDPTKERTLAVVTKPDLLHPGSSNENEYLQVVRGRDVVHNLGLGWHVLRNRADYEKELGSRDSVEEQFFKSGAWASIPAVNRGVAALRKKLSHILHAHIKKSLPAVIDDIQDKLSERETELSRLGQPRSTPEDMRAYLIDIAGRFQSLIHDGMQGHYSDSFFGGFDSTDRKFRSQLRNFNRAIRHILLENGSTTKITQPLYIFPRISRIPSYLRDFLEIHQYNLPAPEAITWADLATQLERQAAANQGTEFPGYANFDVVVQLFQKQSQQWENIAELHVEKVTTAAKTFVDDVFEHIVGPLNTSSTTTAILCNCVDPFFDSKEKLIAIKLQEILRPYKEGYALPLDADFHEAMETQNYLRRARNERKEEENTKDPVKFTALSQSSKEFGTEHIIDTMVTFYDMALRTFTDNLINLAIESCLVRELPSILTPKSVNSMSDATLAELAAESEEVTDRRSQLHEDIRLLRHGLEQCRRYKPRGITANQPHGVPRTSQQSKSGIDRTWGAPTVASRSEPVDQDRDNTTTFTTNELHTTNPSSKGGLFGNASSNPVEISSKPLFNKEQVPPTSSIVSGGLFGSVTSSSQSNPTSTNKGGLFGSPGVNTTASFSTSLFKQEKSNSTSSSVPTGLFGSAISSSQPNPTNTSKGGLFGSPSTNTAGSHPAGLFNQGKSNPTISSAPISLFGSATSPPSLSSTTTPQSGGLFGRNTGTPNENGTLHNDSGEGLFSSKKQSSPFGKSLQTQGKGALTT